MKTYLEYYNDWQNSTESRDLSFEEWLMLQLDRKEKQMIEKVKKALHQVCRWPSAEPLIEEIEREFTKAMEG